MPFALLLLGAIWLMAQPCVAAPGQWEFAGSLNQMRAAQKATLLSAGTVLVTGGVIFGGTTATAEIYNPPKPSLDAVMSQARLEQKVREYLRNSQTLDDCRRPITPDQLQAEMDRMGEHTKQPGVLRELFSSLGDDLFVIAECSAYPTKVIRPVTI